MYKVNGRAQCRHAHYHRCYTQPPNSDHTGYKHFGRSVPLLAKVRIVHFMLKLCVTDQ